MPGDAYDDGVPGEPRYELTRLERDTLAILVDVTRKEKRDLIFDKHLTTFDIGNMSPAVLRGGIKGLVNKGLLTLGQEMNGSDWWEFTADGAEHAHNFVPNSANRIPASDRFVALDHNSKDVQQAKDGLDKIKERVENSNELKADRAQRLAIIREVEGIKDLLNEPLVRAAAIWQAARGPGILNWLAEHGSDAVLNSLVAGVILHLLKTVGLS